MAISQEGITAGDEPAKKSWLNPFVLVIAAAIVCGIGGVGLRLLEEAPQPEVVPKEEVLIRVPLAVDTFEEGRTIAMSDFYYVNLTPKQRGELPVKNFYSNGEQIVGRIIKTTVKKGEPFGLDSLYLEGTGPSPVSELEPGFRGVTISVQLVGGVRGFASPDAWVDVLFRRDLTGAPASATDALSRTLFHSVKVLAVEDQIYPDSQVAATNGRPSREFEITLALTPEQAEIIKSLEGRGTISLSLLPPSELHEAAKDFPSATDLDQLLGIQPPAPAPIAPPEPERIEILRGGQEEIVEIYPHREIAPSVPSGRLNDGHMQRPGFVPQRTPNHTVPTPAPRLIPPTPSGMDCVEETGEVRVLVPGVASSGRRFSYPESRGEMQLGRHRLFGAQEVLSTSQSSRWFNARTSYPVRPALVSQPGNVSQLYSGVAHNSLALNPSRIKKVALSSEHAGYSLSLVRSRQPLGSHMTQARLLHYQAPGTGVSGHFRSRKSVY